MFFRDYVASTERTGLPVRCWQIDNEVAVPLFVNHDSSFPIGTAIVWIDGDRLLTRVEVTSKDPIHHPDKWPAVSVGCTVLPTHQKIHEISLTGWPHNSDCYALGPAVEVPDLPYEPWSGP